MAFIHAVLAIVNAPFVTAYFTKSVPRQIATTEREDFRVRISAGRQATPKEPLRAVHTGEEKHPMIELRSNIVLLI